MDPTLSPSPHRDRALTIGLGALLLLGAHHAAAEYRPTFALWSVGRSAPSVWAPPCALLALHVLGLALLLSRWPRAAAGAACAVILGLYAAVPATYHNNHYLLFVLLLLVALAPTASAAPPDLGRVVRAQLTLVYLSSVVVKLAHPWWRGSGAVVRWLATTRAPEANPDALLTHLLMPLLSATVPSRLADVAVTVLEVAIPLGLAARRTRVAALVVGVLLHLSMQEWLFPQLFTFLMFVGYFAWSPAGDRAWKVTLPRQATVDRTTRIVAFFDPVGRIEVVADPEAARWSLTDPAGRRFHGGWALLRFAPHTPCTVIAYAALALLFPEIRALGPIPRDALENLLVGTLALGFAASIAVHRITALPGS